MCALPFDSLTSRNRTSSYSLLKTSRCHRFTQNVPVTRAEMYNVFQNSHIPSLVPQLNVLPPPRCDNPFLVSYITYQKRLLRRLPAP